MSLKQVCLLYFLLQNFLAKNYLYVNHADLS